jgi:protein involved in polysaccharide export with SLBB domain
VVGPQVSILGKVNRPAVYELLGGENVRDLIDLAGGQSADAFLEMVSIDRIGKDDSRIVYDIDLAGTAIQPDSITILRNGDYVNVPSVSEIKKNIVKLYGHVKHPGVYGLTDSMRISDLIEHGKQLKRDSYLKRANLFRTHPDQTRQIYAVNISDILSGSDSTDFLLMEKDSLVIYSQGDVKRNMTVSIYGAVKNPGIYEYYENMSLSDLIFLAGNTLKQSYMLQAEIARSTPGNPSEIIFANLESALQKRPQDDKALCEDDRVFIRTMPSWKSENKVTVEGQVTFPGEYVITRENEKLTDLFSRCGGFTPEAYPKGLVYIRKSIEDDLKRRQMNTLLASSEPVLLDSLNNPIKSINIDISLDRVNRIVVDMERLLKDPESHQNITLQNGDYIYVPEMPSGVYVLGAVAANGTIAFKKEKSARYFIKAAGGFAGQAERKHTRLVKANGEVLSGYKALHSAIEPGDAIVVPTKIIKDRNWLGTTATIATIVSSLATAILLANSIK